MVLSSRMMDNRERQGAQEGGFRSRGKSLSMEGGRGNLGLGGGGDGRIGNTIIWGVGI